jgi:hypothetical protein
MDAQKPAPAPMPPHPWQWLVSDPRHGQIATLGTLLVYGMSRLGFDIGVPQAATTLGSVLVTQAACEWIVATRAGEPLPPGRLISGLKSALISGLSLCLLLRTDYLALAAVAAALAVASKFLVRVGHKHVFNPTNVAIVALMLTTDGVWVSPGQWGSHAALAFLLASAGLLVVTRAARADVTFAFMAAWTGLLVARSLSLNEPLTIPLHRLESGAFLLFSFFMISDPKTTPDSRAGRVLFAALVALGAAYVQFKLFRTNGFVWALACASPLVPVIDWLLPGRRYVWGAAPTTPFRLPWIFSPYTRRTSMKRITTTTAATILALAAAAAPAQAFCGFYVAKADTRLFNKASQVVLVRDGDRTVVTMSSDFKGDPREFAMVVPVPTAIERGQINVGDKALIEHLDAFTAPRLVEYFDENPCLVREEYRMRMSAAAPAAAETSRDAARAKSLGVTIEARYTVGEYDILILSATESRGLETWLRSSGYRIPAGASDVLTSYIRQNMRFFVAKVNLAEQAKLGFSTLRPIQVAYESPKFMLPVRLGTVNADGPQEMYVYTLTRKGRVETTNYRTVKLRTDVEIPTFVKDPKEFAAMYRAMFDEHVKREQGNAVFQEYAWDMGWCDPCAADPLSAQELRGLGVFWVGDPRPQPAIVRGPRGGGAQDVFVTRLHVRYDRAHFPEDLVFQETGDRTNFQGRYVMRQPWTGPATCPAAEVYRRELRERQEREAQTLASLTGWRIEDIRRRGGLSGATGAAGAPEPWWRQIWR